MTTSDQNQSATLAGLRATLDKRCFPGPRDAEVRPLSDLVDMLGIGLGIEPLEARRVAFDMLSGAVGDGFDWQGSPAHQLPLFERTSLGTFEVSAKRPRPEDCDGATVYPSEREKVLARFLKGEPLPLLVVRYADALESLGVNELRRSLLPPPKRNAESVFMQMESAGVWPRPKVSKGQKPPTWTDFEREAAYELRHVFKVPDSELSKRLGLSRQRINEAIGGKTKAAARLGGKDGWQAPIELQRLAGMVPLESLQAPAPTTTETDRKAA